MFSVLNRMTRLWPSGAKRIEFVKKWYQSKVTQQQEMDDSLGGMFKLTGSNYPVWKSKMRDMLVVKDLWLSVQFGDKRPEKIDATIWDVMHMKTMAYIRCFIDLSLRDRCLCAPSL